jgi:hypothetical protein
VLHHEREKMIEATLNEWKKWYAENRTEECRVIGKRREELDDDEVFIRLWNTQDGEPPEGGESFNSKAWKKPGSTPAPGLVIVTGKGEAPLILTNQKRREEAVEETEKWVKQQAEKASKPKKLDADKNGAGEKAKKDPPASRSLKKPYQWRCRDCGEEFDAEYPKVHCKGNPRQRAEVSRDSTKWFNQFLEDVQWTYMPHREVSTGLIGVIDDEQADALATEAGNSLEKILNGKEISAPKYFDLYNQRTRYLRVSDLKEHSKFKRVINKIASWRVAKQKPVGKAPLGMIEIGHAFDEFLGDTFENIKSDDWAKGERVRFDCEELGVSVGGTPDLNFKGVPVETKTLRVFPHEVPEDKNQKSIFKYKWKRNYAKQAALYLQGVDNEYMLLLLISRESGSFTVVPVSDEAMEGMRENWVVWAEKYEKQLDAYKQLIAEEE